MEAFGIIPCGITAVVSPNKYLYSVTKHCHTHPARWGKTGNFVLDFTWEVPAAQRGSSDLAQDHQVSRRRAKAPSFVFLSPCLLQTLLLPALGLAHCYPFPVAAELGRKEVLDAFICGRECTLGFLL